MAAANLCTYLVPTYLLLNFIQSIQLLFMSFTIHSTSLLAQLVVTLSKSEVAGSIDDCVHEHVRCFLVWVLSTDIQLSKF